MLNLEIWTGLARDVMGAEVAPDEPLMSAGLDSLAAVELRNAIGASFGASLPAIIALDYPTLQVSFIFQIAQSLILSVLPFCIPVVPVLRTR